MSSQTGISWTDSTFNPWIGCTKVSPACDHCYAERDMDRRLKVVEWGPGKPRHRTSAANWRQPVRWNARPFLQCDDCGWRGDAAAARVNDSLMCDRCTGYALKPARRRVFCASLADVFDNEVQVQWLLDLLDLIRQTPNLDWLLLTKRIGRTHAALEDALAVVKDQQRDYALYTWLVDWIMGKPPANVWLGATICNQAEADRDIPKLRAVPARVRFLSIEPMLGPIDLQLGWNNDAGRWDFMGRDLPLRRIDWVIAGGESGPGARPTHPDWVRGLRDQCATAGVSFHFKQWGEWADASGEEPGGPLLRASRSDEIFAADGTMLGAGYREGRKSMGLVEADWRERGGAWMCRVGRRHAGRLLDGREHNEFPGLDR
jgi:protein gp37